MRAVKNNLPAPSGEVGESDGPRWTRAVGDQPAHPLESRREKLGQFQLSFPTEQASEFRSSGRSHRQGPVTPLVRDRWIGPYKRRRTDERRAVSVTP